MLALLKNGNTKMKNSIVLLSLLSLSGCCFESGVHTHVSGRGGFFEPYYNNQITIVNNSPYQLTVVRDGKVIKEINPGDLLTENIYSSISGSEVTVTVTAKTKDGIYAGTLSRVYQLQTYGRRAESWTIARVAPPGTEW
jgi:uncharacterized membrane protein